MSEQPTKLDEIDAKIDALLDKYPELREPNPERQQALGDWLQDHLQEDTDDGTANNR